MKNVMQSRLTRRRMTREILSLFSQAGYDNDTDVSLDILFDEGMMIFKIGGDDETARAVLGGILKIVMDENGVPVEMVEV